MDYLISRCICVKHTQTAGDNTYNMTFLDPPLPLSEVNIVANQAKKKITPTMVMHQSTHTVTKSYAELDARRRVSCTGHNHS